MACSSCSLVFLVLALSFSMNHAQNHTKIVTVTIIDSLPGPSEKMRVECESGGAGERVELLDAGNLYQFSLVKPHRAVITCRAVWKRQIAEWHAFQCRRDRGHDTVFWLVKKHGLFLSWDNSTWIMRSTWETE